MKGLSGKESYFLPFFPFFVDFLPAFFFAMDAVTSSWQSRLTVPKAAC